MRTIQYCLSAVLLGIALIGQAKPEHHRIASIELNNTLQAIRNMQGSFTQAVYTEQNQLLQESKGEYKLDKPGKFYWRVTSPDQNLVVTDGKRAYNYDIDLEQVTIHALENNSKGSPAYLLTQNVDDLNEYYHIIELKDKKNGCLKDSEQCYKLVPKAEQASFLWIEMGFRGKVIRELIVFDQLGQKTQFIFQKIKVNQHIDPSFFVFKAPENVDVIDTTKQ